MSFDPTSTPDPVAAPTSAEETTPTPAPRKLPTMNVYTWMLVLSLLFLSAGCLFLLLEMRRYGFETRPVGF
jgi:hypothetical protein